MKRPVYHQSNLSEFEFCGWGWYLRHVEKARKRGTYWLCRGTGVHKARELNLRQKVESGEDLDVDTMLDAARDAININFKEEDVDTSFGDLKGFSPKIVKGRLVDSTCRMVKLDRQNNQRDMQPLEVEQKIEIHLPNWPFDLAMKLDSIDLGSERREATLSPGGVYISDLKTARQSWTLQKANDQYQPKVYTLGLRAHMPGRQSAFRYHVVVCTPKRMDVKAYSLVVSPTESQIEAVLNRFDAMHNSIQAGLFLPANKTFWKCSPEWCEFYRSCKYAF